MAGTVLCQSVTPLSPQYLPQPRDITPRGSHLPCPLHFTWIDGEYGDRDNIRALDTAGYVIYEMGARCHGAAFFLSFTWEVLV